MHFHSNAERNLAVMILVSLGPLGRTIRIRAALAYRRRRRFRLQVPGWLELTHCTDRAFDLDLELTSGYPVDLANQLSPGLRPTVAARPGTDSFKLIELPVADGDRLAQYIDEATPDGAGPVMAIMDGYTPKNGVLVPVETIRNQLIKGLLKA